MQRRQFHALFAAVACVASVPAYAQDAAPDAPAGLTVPEALLQQAVSRRFPLRYPVPGLLNLDVQVPRLRLMPEQNRLGADMEVVAAGPALHRSHRGSFDMDFGLRFEASDRTVRAHQLRFNRLRFPTLQPHVVDLLNTYGPLLAEQSLMEVVVHQLTPQDLARINALNMQPGPITVSDKGLVIGLVLKPL